MTLPDRKRNRMMGYDYSKAGLYFVTSCVLEKACVFGYVKDEEMQLNEYGRIAERQWLWLPAQYPYIISHAYVVMPNHVHAIIEIDQTLVGTGRDLPAHATNLSARSANFSAHSTNQFANDRLYFGNSGELEKSTDKMWDDPGKSGNDSELPVHDSDRSQTVPTKVKSISGIMGAYKTTTSKLIRQAGLVDFAWQRSFHDHIIRHEKAYRHIEQYIHHNPALWDKDVFYQEPPLS